MAAWAEVRRIRRLDACPGLLVGDANLDGVMIYEGCVIVEANLGVEQYASNVMGDFNQDLAVDQHDLDTLLALLPELDGDFNDDSRVDGADFLHWQRSSEPANGLTEWAANFGATATAANSTAFPEPTPWLMLSLGALALSVLHWWTKAGALYFLA